MQDKEQISKELLEEEVNVYTKDCGASKLKCVTDCLLVLPALSTAKWFGRIAVMN